MRIRKISDKAPEEIIPVSFDFTELLTSIDSVVVSVSVNTGTDNNPGALLFSSAQIQGAVVTHLIQQGLTDVTYLIKATATSGDIKYSLACYLPVKALL